MHCETVRQLSGYRVLLMEEQNEYYDSSLHQKGVKQIRNPCGGVLNVQSDLDVLQGDVDTIQNKDIINSDSVIKSSQRGQVNSSGTLTASQTKTVTVNFSTVDKNKSVEFHDFIVNNVFNRVSIESVTFNQNTYSIKLVNSGTNSNDYTLTGEWKIVEFY